MKLTSIIAASALLAGLGSPVFAGTLTKVTPGPSSQPSSSSEAPPPATSSEAPQPEVSSEAPSDTSSSAEPEQPAAAGPLVTAEDPQTILNELSVLGYPGKLSKTSDGYPEIALRIAGENTYIDFDNCDDNESHCETILFNIGATIKGGVTPGKANEWNSKKILGRIWLDQDSNPVLDYTVSTYEGLSPSVFDETMKAWADVVQEFKSEYNLR